MKTFIHLAQPTGNVYEIPVAVIANSRAAYYHKACPDEFPTLESAMEDTVELFKDDLCNVKDWAAYNMNWSDLQRDAKLIRFSPSTDTQWYEGEWSYHERQAIVGELDGETIMQTPVEAVLNSMAASGQVCSVTILNSHDGKALGGVAVFMGSPQVVETFIATLTHTTNALTGGVPDNAPTH